MLIRLRLPAVKAMEYHKDNLSYLFAEDYEGEDAIKADMEHVLAAYARRCIRYGGL